MIIVAKKTTTWGESGFPSEFLGEYGRTVSASAVPSHEQLIDDLGEFGRTVNSSAGPSNDQLMDDMGEFGRVANPETSVPSHDQLIDDLNQSQGGNYIGQ